MTRIAPEFSDTDKFDVNAPSFESLTDADLFRICGGRTAHKYVQHFSFLFTAMHNKNETIWT